MKTQIDWKASIDEVASLIGTTFRNQRLLSTEQLMDTLDSDNRRLVEWLLSVKPSDFDVEMEFFGYKEPPAKSEFEILKRYLRNLEGKPVLDIQYVPKVAFKAFEDMKLAMLDELDAEMKISSAYRSPAFQVLVVCYNWRRYEYDAARTFKYTALPGYSEHGLHPDVALDLQFGGEEYVRTDRIDNFTATKEFNWLEANAARFGFYLPYHKNNGVGVMFEPWHWRFRG